MNLDAIQLAVNLDAIQLAVIAFVGGKQHVEGTRDVMAYLVGKCNCPLVWNAYDATQIQGVAQGFVAHMMRRHGKDDMTTPRRSIEQKNLLRTFVRFLVEWTDEYNHWRERQHSNTHRRNLDIAVQRFVELMEEAAANNSKATSEPTKATTESIDYDEQIARLAETFPILEFAPLRPWDSEKFELWALGQSSSALQHSARFVLAVWSMHTEWKIGHFDVMAALGAWDMYHREAFARWMDSPWWH